MRQLIALYELQQIQPTKTLVLEVLKKVNRHIRETFAEVEASATGKANNL